ncbi:hypothetical protein DMENIID0001_055530 [Sergentomyia squamirostris]
MISIKLCFVLVAVIGIYTTDVSALQDVVPVTAGDVSVPLNAPVEAPVSAPADTAVNPSASAPVNAA